MIVDVTQSDGPAAIRGNVFADLVPDAYFLVASLSGVPVGQVCHRVLEDRWHMDFLFVRRDLREVGLGELLVECCCHDALRHTDEVYALARRNGGRLDEDNFRRHTRNVGGDDSSPEVRVLREDKNLILNVRDLQPLRDRVERGVVGRVTFPHQRVLSPKRDNRSEEHVRRPTVSA